MVGESDPTDISTARFINRSLIITNGKNSGTTMFGFARMAMAWAEQIPPNSAMAGFRW